MTPILRPVTIAPEDPKKDPADALAGAAAVTGDPRTSIVLAGALTGTGGLVSFLGSLTTVPEKPREDPIDAFAGVAAVTGDPESSVMFAGDAAVTDDPVIFLGLPLELSPKAHES